VRSLKLAFHDAETDTDIFAEIHARIVARRSACRSACHRKNFRKSRVSDVSARILARMSVHVGVGVVEFQLYSSQHGGQQRRRRRSNHTRLTQLPVYEASVYIRRPHMFSRLYRHPTAENNDIVVYTGKLETEAVISTCITRAGIASDNRVTLTFDVLSLGSVHHIHNHRVDCL